MNTDRMQPHNASAAIKLALGAGIAAGLITYMVNGQDFARAAISAALWVVIGWYSGKALPAPDEPDSQASTAKTIGKSV